MARSEEIQHLINQTDLRAIAKDHGVKPGKSRNSFHCFNPTGHRNGDKTPSLAIYKDHFKCFGCGISGDVFTLLEMVRGYSFKEALTHLRPSHQRYSNHLKYKDNSMTKFRVVQPPKKPEVKPEPEKALYEHKDYLGFMEKLWQLLSPTTLSQQALEWLASRSLSSEVAYQYGCREFPAIREALFPVLAQTNLVNLGLATQQNPDQLWFPMRKLDSFEMLAIPCWSPRYSFPIQWRCRLYKPWDQGKMKVFAQPSVLGGVEPLGMKGYLSRKTILICEGEPDFFTLKQTVSPNVSVIGICSVAQGWKEEWTRYIAYANKICIVLHDTRESRIFAAQVALQVAQASSIGQARKSMLRFLVDEDNDLNDFLKNQTLAPWIQKLSQGGVEL
jgi:hypothetical protein